MKNFLKTLLSHADWVAFIVIAGVLIIALFALLVSLPVVAMGEPAVPSSQRSLPTVPIHPFPKARHPIETE